MDSMVMCCAHIPAGNPLPSIIHKVVCQQELGPGRVVLVGDVHGCYEELQQLLQQVQLRHGYDNLMFVGDLVNKGPKSQQVGHPSAEHVIAVL